MIQFRAFGVPQPQGSSRAFVRGGRAHITTANPKLHSWRDVIGWEATRAMVGTDMIDMAPVEVRATFILSRPKSAPKSRQWPTTKPDSDKLARGLLDAITGVCFRDDSQVIWLTVGKRYAFDGEQPGVEVTVKEVSAS